MSDNTETAKKSVAARLVSMAQERYLLGLSEEGEPFGADRDRPHLVMLLRAGKALMAAVMGDAPLPRRTVLRRNRRGRRRPGAD